MPRSSATSGALTRLTDCSRQCESSPCRAKTASACVSPEAMRPRAEQVRRLRRAGEDLREEPAERLGKLGERLQFRRERHAEVDRVLDFAFLEERADLARDRLGDLDLRLLGAGAEVRREDDVPRRAQRAVGRERLRIEHVERGAGQPAVVERLDERRLVHDAAARAVDQAAGGLHFRQRRRADQAAGLVGQRRVDRDEVRPLPGARRARPARRRVPSRGAPAGTGRTRRRSSPARSRRARRSGRPCPSRPRRASSPRAPRR